MHRLRSMAHLGIEVYAPRRPLPQAAASAFSLHAPELEASQPNAPLITPGNATGRRVPLIDLPEKTVPRDRRQPVAAARPATEVDSVRFQLLTVAFESGVMVVSDLRSAPLQAALEATVMQFLCELMFALGQPTAPGGDPAYFQWPLVNKPGIDTGESRAREVLAGFINRNLAETRPQHVLLLGERAGKYVQIGETKDCPRVWRYDAPLGMLFARPHLKAGLWQALQAMVVDG